MKKLILIGYVGNVRFSTETQGDPVLEFSLAINEPRSGGEGEERKQETTWFSCELWGERATKLKDSIQKGSHLYVEGNIKIDAYLTNDKKPAAKVICRVRSLEFLGSAPKPEEASK